MRDIRHDNINQFLGACVDTNNILIITQYGVRGSLQVIVVYECSHLLDTRGNELYLQSTIDISNSQETGKKFELLHLN